MERVDPVSYTHLESLEESIEKLKGDNDALLTRINTSVDLDYVYKVATEELGMVYANKDQVRLYNKTDVYKRQGEKRSPREREQTDMESREELVNRIEEARKRLNGSIDGKEEYDLIYRYSVELDRLIEELSLIHI